MTSTRPQPAELMSHMTSESMPAAVSSSLHLGLRSSFSDIFLPVLAQYPEDTEMTAKIASM